MRRCARQVVIAFTAALGVAAPAVHAQDAPATAPPSTPAAPATPTAPTATVQPEEAPTPAPTPPATEAPVVVETFNSPPLEEVSRSLVAPRFAAFSRAAAQLQNLTLRRCSLDRRVQADMEAAYVEAMRAGSAAVALAFGSDFNRGASRSVMTPFGESGLARTQFAVLLSSAQDGPSTLSALRNLEPAYIGLPALEYALFEREDGDGRCRLAITLAAQVATIARTLERRWTSGLLEPQWIDDDMEFAARRRLFDLLSGMLTTLSRTQDVLAAPPRGTEGRITGNDRANAAFLKGRLDALLAMARAIDSYAIRGTGTEAITKSMVDTLVALKQGARDLESAPNRETAAAMTSQLASLQRFVQKEMAQSFGFAPEALDPLFVDRAPSQ